MLTVKQKLLSALGTATLLVAAPAANADVLGASLVASGGEITIRFEGSDAGYESLISVNGPPEIFPNHSTAVGTEFSLGSFSAGTALDIMLHVLTTGQVFHTGPGALNVDGLAHAVVNTVGDRTFVSFEDQVGGGDLDYDDHAFSFVGVTVVPEPSALALLLAGMGVVGFVGARRRKD